MALVLDDFSFLPRGMRYDPLVHATLVECVRQDVTLFDAMWTLSVVLWKDRDAVLQAFMGYAKKSTVPFVVKG